MSANVFDKVFDKGSEGPLGIDVGECGPIDIVRSLVRKILAADATIKRAVKRVEAYDFAPAYTGKGGTAIYVQAAPFSNTDTPSNATTLQIEVQVIVRWGESSNVDEVADFRPTVFSLANRCDWVLGKDPHLVATYNDGMGGSVDIPTAQKSQPSGTPGFRRAVDGNGSHIYSEYQFARVYDVVLDAESGRIKELAKQVAIP